MKISIIHPTRGRKIQAINTMKKWLNLADCPYDIEYIFSIDSDDTEEWNDINHHNVFIFRNANKSTVEAVNIAAKKTTANIMIVVSDDFSCIQGWDTLLLNEIEYKSDFLLKTFDGIQNTLVTLPILDRIYYNRFGYIYHPDYLHMHCDEEMTIVSLMLGRYIKSDLMFEHEHHSTGKTIKDSISIKNDDTWNHGQDTINRRAINNFDIINPLVKREDIIW